MAINLEAARSEAVNNAKAHTTFEIVARPLSKADFIEYINSLMAIYDLSAVGSQVGFAALKNDLDRAITLFEAQVIDKEQKGQVALFLTFFESMTIKLKDLEKKRSEANYFRERIQSLKAFYYDSPTRLSLKMEQLFDDTTPLENEKLRPIRLHLSKFASQLERAEEHGYFGAHKGKITRAPFASKVRKETTAVTIQTLNSLIEENKFVFSQAIRMLEDFIQRSLNADTQRILSELFHEHQLMIAAFSESSTLGSESESSDRGEHLEHDLPPTMLSDDNLGNFLLASKTYYV